MLVDKFLIQNHLFLFKDFITNVIFSNPDCIFSVFSTEVLKRSHIPVILLNTYICILLSTFFNSKQFYWFNVKILEFSKEL